MYESLPYTTRSRPKIGTFVSGFRYGSVSNVKLPFFYLLIYSIYHNIYTINDTSFSDFPPIRNNTHLTLTCPLTTTVNSCLDLLFSLLGTPTDPHFTRSTLSFTFPGLCPLINLTDSPFSYHPLLQPLHYSPDPPMSFHQSKMRLYWLVTVEN